MEYKGGFKGKDGKALKLVLIETLWNIKKAERRIQEILQTVLIETLWNIKINLTLLDYMSKAEY